MLSDAEIDAGKVETKYSMEPLHEHNDCIRLAYEWLDAQTKTGRAIGRFFPIKHIVERWAGRYVSQTDVEVAATMHPDIQGRYPRFNISSRLVRPHDRRLEGIGEARKQAYREHLDETIYSRAED